MAENVFLFWPNLIGYARIVLAIISFYFMPTCYCTASTCYIVSALLDAVDGHVARWRNESSRFGAMLDMLTDRCATLCLIMILGHFYPRWMLAFQLSAAIDVASHWLHMHSHDLKGSKSHKSVSQTTNPILVLYYTSRQFLFFMCAGNEGFYCMLYLLHFTYGPIIPIIRVGLWQVMAVLCFPIAFVKTAISVVHLVTAAQTIADVDVAEREAMGKQSASATLTTKTD